MWDAPPFDKSKRTGRIATGAEANLIKAAVSGLCGAIESEEEFRELGMPDCRGFRFSTYPFQNMTVEQLWWFCSSMTAAMLQEDVPKPEITVMTESFIYELISQIQEDLDEPDLWAEQTSELLFDFVGRTYIDDETDQEIERSIDECMEALGQWLWLEDDDCLEHEMQNRSNDDPLHLFMGTSTDYYNMIAHIPTEAQVKQSREYLKKIGNEGFALISKEFAEELCSS